MNRHCLCFISALTLTAGLFAQDPKVQLPKLSPTATLKQNVGLTDIDLVYSRPGVKGRAIFGKMIPFASILAGDSQVPVESEAFMAVLTRISSHAKDRDQAENAGPK